MEQSTTRTGICPGCQHTITVPGELESFSCLYCGKRLTPEQLMASQPTAPTDAHREETLRRLTRELPQAIYGEPDTLKYMTKTSYPSRLAAYLEHYQELFALIPQLCLSDDIQTLASDVVEAIDHWATEQKRGLTTKDALLEEAKFTLCLLTIPAIRTFIHSSCEELAKALQEAWAKKYPRNPFRLATREEILAGFQPRKLCYITTAVCRQAGKPDDCRELTAFRHFRDTYLAQKPGGEDLIARYYELAPGIVMAIDLCRDPQEVYPAIWQTHLRPCYEALLLGDTGRCQQLYTQMVEQLPEKLRAGQKIS